MDPTARPLSVSDQAELAANPWLKPFVESSDTNILAAWGRYAKVMAACRSLPRNHAVGHRVRTMRGCQTTALQAQTGWLP